MINQLSDIIAVLILSDANVDPQEIAAFVVGCEGLGIKTAVAEQALGKSLTEAEQSTNQDEFLRRACEPMPKARRETALAIGVSVVMANERLDRCEVDRLIALRLMLGLPEDSLLKLVAQMSSVQPNLDVVF